MGPTLATLYIVFWIVATGYAVGAAAHAGLLVVAAVPLAAVLIAVLRIAGPTIEQIGWAAFTGWLGMTYAHTGGPVETAVFFAYVGLGALGVFSTPYALGCAWLLHVAWDFLPRDLPGPYASLPLACAFFDIPIALYMLGCARYRRWRVLLPATAPRPDSA